MLLVFKCETVFSDGESIQLLNTLSFPVTQNLAYLGKSKNLTVYTSYWSMGELYIRPDSCILLTNEVQWYHIIWVKRVDDHDMWLAPGIPLPIGCWSTGYGSFFAMFHHAQVWWQHITHSPKRELLTACLGFGQSHGSGVVRQQGWQHGGGNHWWFRRE